MKPDINDIEKRLSRCERKLASLDMLIEIFKQQKEVYDRLEKYVELNK